MDKKKKQLKEILEKLGKIRGRHTELVTVYVPAGFSLDKIASQVRQEQSTAQNIKSKAVRKNVLSALERILQHLKLYKQTPKNGLAIFSGNVSEKDGVADVEIWAVEPPEPVRTKLYWCGQDFILDPLKEIFREREIYGLIVLDKSEAEIGLLSGKKLESLKHMESIVPGKTKKGGWSQARYARIREGLLNDFMKKIGEIASAKFKGLKDLRGIIIGGPGPIKEMFNDGDFLTYDVKKKVLGVIDTSYSGMPGLQELVERSDELLKEASIMREKHILDRFFGEFAKDSGLAMYGLHEVIDALKAGSIEVLLLSDGFDWIDAKFECAKCDFKKDEVVQRKDAQGHKCDKCGSPLKITGENDLAEEIIKLAENSGTKIENISTDTNRGEQLKELGGIAGILRYRQE
jgi:peptide chain release factor subunit 1